jgi:serine protease AprX
MTHTKASRFWPLRWQRLALLLLVLGTALGGKAPVVAASPVHAQAALLRLAATHPATPVRVIVQRQGHGAGVEQLVTRLGGRVTSDLSIINALVATLPAGMVPVLAAAPGVRWISLDAPVVHASSCSQCISTTNLLSTDVQDIRATNVWNEGPGYVQGQGIGVAVVDSGVNPSQDLYTVAGTNRLVANVYFNSGPNQTTFDAYGHGDHVAGIIADNGSRSNGEYIGVAPMANIINVKVSDDQGASTASQVVQGLQWVLNNKNTYKIRIVNLSLNSTISDSYNVDPIDAAAEILWFNGIVVVTSAGNNGGNGVVYAPANDPFVITVGAVDDHGSTNTANHTLATYSAYGATSDGYKKPDMVAPGANLVSLSGNVNCVLCVAHPDHVVNGPSGSVYLRMSGTSMAAAVASGAVALLLKANPNLTPDQVKYRLMTTAHPLAAATSAGAGELDIYNAVHGTSTANANTGIPISKILWTGSQPTVWNSANWGSANWGSANWGSANWGSANWGSDYWGS